MRHLHQQTNFTCGPVCLMRALAHFLPGYKPGVDDEFLIWRTANTLYMVEGHPGCGPYGLAVEAQRRGLKAVVYDYYLAKAFKLWNKHNPLHMEKCLLMHQLDLQESLKQSIEVNHQLFDLETIKQQLAAGAVVMLLDMSEPAGHWVALEQHSAQGWQVFDPYLTADGQPTWSDDELLARMVEHATSSRCMLVLYPA